MGNDVPTIEPWRRDLHRFADDIAAEFARRHDVLGVAIGGSIARGTEWLHSDVELGLLVESPLADVGYFHVVDRRGYEAIQLAAPKWREKIDRAEIDPLAVAGWPPQLFECRIVHDPSGWFARFKRTMDALLMRDDVRAMRVKLECLACDKTLTAARDDLAARRPFAAIARARQAINHVLLALYWSHGVLPRSQNRCELLLRETCERFGRSDVHATFVDVYDLEPFDEDEARSWLRDARPDIDRIALAWGVGAPAFFRHACDGELAWGVGRSILAVHRLCLPQCLRAAGHAASLDDPAWRGEHASLVRLLGLADEVEPRAASILDRVAATRATIGA